MDNIKDLLRIGKQSIKDKMALDKGGNISIRKKNYMLIKASGVRLDKANKNDYVKVFFENGKDEKKKASSEKFMHMQCYQKRKDINAVVHLHSVCATALANSKLKVGNINYEVIACLGSDLIRASYRPSASKALAEQIGKYIKKSNGILLSNHGILTVGRNLKQAYMRALAVERAAAVILFSKLLSKTSFLPKKEASRIISIYKDK